MKSLIAVSLLTVTACMATSSVEAAAKRQGTSSITACSNFGKGCISGPTRPARFGLEVRMPGGTWIACTSSCQDALRVATVDFWAQRDQERGGAEWRR